MVRDLPLEIIIEIFKYADFRCCMCQKKLLPGGMYRYFPHVKTTESTIIQANKYICSEECFRNTCVHQ